MRIREMTSDDLNAVIALDHDVFSHPYNQEAFEYELYSNAYAHLFVLEDVKIIGYIDLWVIYDRAELARIAICRDDQGKHLAEYLFNEVIKQYNDLHNVTLEVRVSNSPAISLYKRLGFKEVAIRKNYYENQEDGILMMKEGFE